MPQDRTGLQGVKENKNQKIGNGEDWRKDKKNKAHEKGIWQGMLFLNF